MGLDKRGEKLPKSGNHPLCPTDDVSSKLLVMKITDEALKEFGALLREDYPNEKFTKKQILESAIRVMRAVKQVYRPIPQKRILVFDQMKM